MRPQQGCSAANGIGRTSAALNSKTTFHLGGPFEGVTPRWNHFSLTGEWGYSLLCLIRQRNPVFRDTVLDYSPYLRENFFPFRSCNFPHSSAITLCDSQRGTLSMRTVRLQQLSRNYIVEYSLSQISTNEDFNTRRGQWCNKRKRKCCNRKRI